MANGTSDEKLARADRIKEQSRRAQHQADQNRKATANAIEAIRGRNLPGSQPYRAEMESEVSEVKVPGGMAKLPIPRAGRIAIAFGLAILFVCIGISILVRSWPH